MGLMPFFACPFCEDVGRVNHATLLHVFECPSWTSPFQVSSLPWPPLCEAALERVMERISIHALCALTMGFVPTFMLPLPSSQENWKRALRDICVILLKRVQMFSNGLISSETNNLIGFDDNDFEDEDNEIFLNFDETHMLYSHMEDSNSNEIFSIAEDSFSDNISDCQYPIQAEEDLNHESDIDNVPAEFIFNNEDEVEFYEHEISNQDTSNL